MHSNARDRLFTQPMANMAAKPGAADVSISLGGQYGYQQVVIHHSEDSELGRGSYGAVVRARLDDLPCAAKIFHHNFFNSRDPAARDFAARFQQECEILRDLKHPNIVQFLGVVQDPSSGRLVLLMEIMRESLTHFLELSATRLPLHVQVNIAHDVALAVAHLHRNRILHRDLSSNNILLNAGCQAKVTDFGMSRIADSNPSMTRSRVTLCPGTLVYMPPEALLSSPRYSEKLDSFSLGVLMIQIITRKFPSPTEAHTTREDASSPTGEIIVPVAEAERRRTDMSDIPPDHALLAIARDCLKDRYQQRPDAAQLCQSLAALKTTPAYQESSSENPDLLASLSPIRPSAPAIRDDVEEVSKQLQSLPLSEEEEKAPVGRTELHDAAERGDVKAVKRLLSTSVNINSRTEDGGDSALLLAALRGHVAVVNLFIEAGAMANLQDKDGCSPVYVASQNGHTDIVELLVQAGADIHLATTEHGSVPLGTAAEKGLTETVQRLLELGANPNHQTKAGKTPLYSASRKGYVAVVRLLLERRAGVNICDKDGCSPVYVASGCGHTDVVDLLVQAGADIHLATTEEHGNVPLEVAAGKGLTETVQRLLELGANVNRKNKTGSTSLHCAAKNGHSEVVQLLLRTGATDTPSKRGNRALNLARANHHTEVVQLLLPHAHRQ